MWEGRGKPSLRAREEQGRGKRSLLSHVPPFFSLSLRQDWGSCHRHRIQDHQHSSVMHGSSPNSLPLSSGRTRSVCIDSGSKRAQVCSAYTGCIIRMMHTLFAGRSQDLKRSPRFPVKGLLLTPPLHFLSLHPPPAVDSSEKSSVDWRKQEVEITEMEEEEDTKNWLKSHMGACKFRHLF